VDRGADRRQLPRRDSTLTRRRAHPAAGAKYRTPSSSPCRLRVESTRQGKKLLAAGLETCVAGRKSTARLHRHGDDQYSMSTPSVAGPGDVDERHAERKALSIRR
jgi:hypothetical protein